MVFLMVIAFPLMAAVIAADAELFQIARPRVHRRWSNRRYFLQFTFGQPGHDLDEIAGPVADIELPFQDAVPAILHRAGRAGQGEQIGAACNPGTGARLHRGGADLGIGNLVEERGEAVDLFFEHAFEGFHRDVAPGQPGAAGRDHHIAARILDPGPELRRDPALVVGHDGAGAENMPGILQPLHQRIAGDVVVLGAGVRHGEHRDVHRHEGDARRRSCPRQSRCWHRDGCRHRVRLN